MAVDTFNKRYNAYSWLRFDAYTTPTGTIEVNQRFAIHGMQPGLQTSDPLRLRYITPRSGTTAGGTTVTLYVDEAGTTTGSGTLGGNAVTIVTWTDDLITFTTPAGTAGAADLVITTNDSRVDTLTTTKGGWTYVVVDAVTPATTVDGPDGKTSSAIEGTGSLYVDNVSITNGTIAFWHKSLSTLTLDSTPISLTTHGTYDGWSLVYATGVTGSGRLLFSAANASTDFQLFDIRTYDSTISTNALNNYYGDVSENNGNNYLPFF